MASFLYVISHPSGLRKIGYSNRPGARLSQLQHNSGEALNGEFLFPCDDAEKFEAIVHKALASKRVMGEWFHIEKNAALSAIREATGLNHELFDKTGKPWAERSSSNETLSDLEISEEKAEFLELLRSQGCTVRRSRNDAGPVTVTLGSKATQLPIHGSRKALGSGLVNKILKDLGLK